MKTFKEFLIQEEQKTEKEKQEPKSEIQDRLKKFIVNHTYAEIKKKFSNIKNLSVHLQELKTKGDLMYNQLEGKWKKKRYFDITEKIDQLGLLNKKKEKQDNRYFDITKKIDQFDITKKIDHLRLLNKEKEKQEPKSENEIQDRLKKFIVNHTYAEIKKQFSNIKNLSDHLRTLKAKGDLTYNQIEGKWKKK